MPPPKRPTKWYLFSEEDTTETSNTNYFEPCQDETSDVRSFGANLQQLFPVTCAVPDLSTITEMSEKSQAGNRGDTDLDTQSNFWHLIIIFWLIEVYLILNVTYVRIWNIMFICLCKSNIFVELIS